MRVISYGIHPTLANKIFTCKKCSCEFEASAFEYQKTIPDALTDDTSISKEPYLSRCPCCESWVFGA